jgi:hypothetical protein
LGVGEVVKLGPLPVKFALELQYMPIHPREFGQSWHPGGIMPVVGTTNPDRLRACCQGAKVELSRIQWYRIYSAAMGHGVP